MVINCLYCIINVVHKINNMPCDTMHDKYLQNLLHYHPYMIMLIPYNPRLHKFVALMCLVYSDRQLGLQIYNLRPAVKMLLYALISGF